MGGEVAGADQLRGAVRERAERGLDVVKVMSGGGGGTTPGTGILACQFTVDELRVVVDEAHAARLAVTIVPRGTGREPPVVARPRLAAGPRCPTPDAARASGAVDAEPGRLARA
jgi:hypothetical protein